MCLFDKCEICKGEYGSWLPNACESINIINYDKIRVCTNCKLKHFKQIKESFSTRKIWIYCNNKFYEDPEELERYCQSEEQKEIVNREIGIYKKGVMQYNPSPTFETVLVYKPVHFTILQSEEEKANFSPEKPHRYHFYDVFTVEKYYNIMGFPQGDYICITNWIEEELAKVNLKIEKLTQKRRKLENK